MGSGITKSLNYSPPPPLPSPLPSSSSLPSSTSLTIIHNNSSSINHFPLKYFHFKSHSSSFSSSCYSSSLSSSSSSLYLANKQQYDLLLLSENDISQLFKVFTLIDQRKCGWIEPNDILNYLNIKTITKFIIKIFLVLDYEDNGKINFFQFVIACWSLCTLNQRDYCLYLFELYDLDEIGFIDVKIAQQILVDIYGDHFDTDLQARRAYEQLEGIGNRSIDPFTFQRYGGGHPRTLYYVFTIQCLTRKGIVSEDFWEEKTLQRAQLNPGLHISVYSLLGRSFNRKKKKCTTKSTLYQTPLTTIVATGPQSTEDFKTSKHLETDVSLNGQQSLQTLPHSDLKRDLSFGGGGGAWTFEPETYEMETIT